MNRAVEITPPVFEAGPKAYMFGPDVVRVAIRADELSREYGVQIIFDPQYVDIPTIAQRVERVLVFAQHMDSLEPGRGMGSVLPEALKAAGASGVVLNHFERRLSAEELERAVRRADEVGLATVVCADGLDQALAIAALAPNAIIVESPQLIGAGKGHDTSRAAVLDTNRAIWQVNPDIVVIRGAGIGDAHDVFDVIAAGAQGTGSSSAIFAAEDPERVLEAMIRAVREAWDSTH